MTEHELTINTETWMSHAFNLCQPRVLYMTVVHIAIHLFCCCQSQRLNQHTLILEHFSCGVKLQRAKTPVNDGHAVSTEINNAIQCNVLLRETLRVLIVASRRVCKDRNAGHI